VSVSTYATNGIRQIRHSPAGNLHSCDQPSNFATPTGRVYERLIEHHSAAFQLQASTVR